MKLFNRAALAACLFTAAGAASATTFSVTNAVFTPGSGYGSDGSNETGGTLLDVVFANTGFSNSSFDLSTVGSSKKFTVGTVNFNEPNGIGGITDAERDNLDVSLALTFAAPGNVVNTILAAGTAFRGSVQDNAVDFTLTWAPITMNFGTTGLYTISFGDLAFATARDSVQNLVATVTLTAADTAVAADVPEPGSLGLLAIGMIGAGVLRRRTAK